MSDSKIQAALTDITERLRLNRFPNESAISQGVVLRVLQCLGWDVYEPEHVWPEYQTGEGRADFALCCPAKKPAVFIEVKQPGKAEDSVRQALEYAFHTGVPLIVLTDGRTWSFYLPAEQGSYEDRRVYKLDLYERGTNDAADVLERYLGFERTVGGNALSTARDEYRSRNRRAQAKAAISDAWIELVERGDETLVDLLAGAVESKAGVRPDVDDVADFLARLTKVERSATNRQKEPKQPVKAVADTQPVQVAIPEPDRKGSLTILGKPFPFSSAKSAMVIVLTELALRDAKFLQRCAVHEGFSGRKRRYIAENPGDLYPDREDLWPLKESLSGGWFVSTNLNNQLKLSIIRAAAEVAGLEFGRDLVVSF